MAPPTTPAPADPFALRPDGAAVDPAAFRAAALADPAIARDLAADPDTRAVLESGDDGALQELLKAVFVVRGRERAGGGGERGTPGGGSFLNLCPSPTHPRLAGRDAPRRARRPHHVGAHH